MWRDISLICIFMLSEWFVLAFPRFWRQAETSSHFIFWTWKEIFRVSLLHVSLKISFLDFLCGWCSAPVCPARHFPSVRNVFPLLATVKHPKYFRCSDGIIWNRFPCSGSDAYDGITDGKRGAVSIRRSSAKNTTESREGGRNDFLCDGI